MSDLPLKADLRISALNVRLVQYADIHGHVTHGHVTDPSNHRLRRLGEKHGRAERTWFQVDGLSLQFHGGIFAPLEDAW